MIRWWQYGLIGAIALSIATFAKFVVALLRGVEFDGHWGELPRLALAVFGMGFMCGTICWAGKGLSRRFGMAGDALLGLVVMVAFFLACMVLYAPEFLGNKFRNGGAPMLLMAIVLGVAGGAWIGRDFRREFDPQAKRYQARRRRTPPTEPNPFENENENAHLE